MSSDAHRKRRLVVMVVLLLIVIGGVAYNGLSQRSAPQPPKSSSSSSTSQQATGAAAKLLGTLAVQASASSAGYARTQFGDGWEDVAGCDMRDRILQRDLTHTTLDKTGCKVETGTLQDPYTSKSIAFTRGASTSSAVQIDHVVALGDVWQTGGQQLTSAQRLALANDPLELLAVDGPTNEAKGDADASEWLPPNTAYRCQYVARQIAVKAKYHLWVTSSEKSAMTSVLATCPGQQVPAVN